MAYLFSPPSFATGETFIRGMDATSRRLFAHFEAHSRGYDIRKVGATYVQSTETYTDDHLAADELYLGGHYYLVSDEIASDLTDAGFGAGLQPATPGGFPHAAGAFSISFADYPDGPVPEEDTGLRDNFLDDPDNEDEMGISGGRLAVAEFRGPDQSFTAGGGRRGFLWRNTATLTDNVSAPVEVPLSGEAGNVGGAPLLHVNEDSTYIGVSCWFVPAPFNWTELGLVGKRQEDFSYLDLAPGTTMPEEGDDIRLRSVGGSVAVEVNGVTVCGPVELPADIAGSANHGVQMDVAADADENVGMVEGVTIESDSTPLATRSAPLTPTVGTAAETASASTIDVPYPGTLVAGNTLVCIVATKNGGTFSSDGWTSVSTQFGVVAGVQIGALQKTAVGDETGSLTVTKSTAGIMSGVMVQVSGSRLITMSGQGLSSGTTLTAPAIQLFGPYRTMLWLAALNADQNITDPDGFFALSALNGAQALRLAVSVAVIDTHDDYPGPPFNAYASSHFPAQVGTAAGAATSAVGSMILHPEYG